MVDDGALLETFEDFATGLVNPFDVDEVLHTLIERVVEVVGVDGAGVSLAREDQLLGFVAATDPVVAEVEEHQDVQGGPCHQAYLDREPVVVDDLAEEERWPAYRQATHDLGFRAVVAVPLPTNTGPIGALNLYQVDPRAWSEREVEVAQMMAAMASGYLLTSVALSTPDSLSTQLGHALASRALVEQAGGILGGRLDLDRRGAFDALQALADRHDTTLHDAARRLVDDPAFARDDA
ncbi:GAF and ANTAR domain-containing protein [Salsipaludibacter albus]|uniref:GAF and ANTAR domain-containing protein n=1 Tax=Salsipaludibacter albus TaxID=2849650 RepID=UPI001EE3CA52|nr:GAF and ANTAR domain-containing protein [Salsipaludibacter albus]